MFANLMFGVLFFAIPAIPIVLFGIGLYCYISAKKKNKTAPGAFTDNEIKKRKGFLIVLSVVIAVLVAVVIGFMILMSIALDSM